MTEEEDSKMAELWPHDGEGVILFVSHHSAFHTTLRTRSQKL
jgi:hypothetical protein